MRSAALVSSNGTIDWFCPERFDHGSVFGAILDTDNGGHWSITASDPEVKTRQFYLPDTNVLVTRFSTAGGVVEVRDAMPVLRANDPDHRQRIVRQIVGIRGQLPMQVALVPRLDYGQTRTHVERAGMGALITGGDWHLVLHSTASLADVRPDGIFTTFNIHEGDEVGLTLAIGQREDVRTGDTVDAAALLAATVDFWQQWLRQSNYRGRWREIVHRSALALKLLTHEPTGAVIAAPTTSLPEVPGGERNWDYRHVWVRDAAFSMYALLRLGFADEAGAFVKWLMHRIDDGLDGDLGPLRSMYDIDGGSAAGEYELDHWAGHDESRPVRVRNDAAEQLQLDVYGEFIDSVYLYDKHGDGIGYDDWNRLRAVVDWLADHWSDPDEGIWETRAGRHQHTYSQMMSWVAFERMIRMARRRGLPGDLTSWARTRDAIAESVHTGGWNQDLQAYTQAFGGTTLDASLLLMPAVKFLSPADPRFASTLKAVQKHLVTDTLVFRYNVADSPDGLDGEEGTFSMCSFWYVEALTRIGQLDEAKLALEKMFTYSNPVGLFAEEIGLDGSQLGNFPQAFTHFSLISAAVNLDRALG